MNRRGFAWSRSTFEQRNFARELKHLPDEGWAFTLFCNQPKHYEEGEHVRIIVK
jgi:hypothetical protein